MARIMIFDGAPAAAQRIIASHGGPSNSELFERALALHATDLDCFTVNVADGERLPQGLGVGDFDGVVITGSPLNVYRDEPAVARQIGLAREVFAAGVPTWGSCWGLQLMTVALGGVVRLNPRGREIGIARHIALNEAGRAHPLFAGKAQAFDALCSHLDEVATLPDDAIVLAGNGVSRVQAVEIARGAGSFQGVQYHPEMTFATAAAIIESRQAPLLAEGFARCADDLRRTVADLRAVEAEPGRADLAWRLGLERHVVEPKLRTAELGNWLRAKVAPHRARRAAAG